MKKISITKNHKITKIKKKNDGVPFKDLVAS